MGTGSLLVDADGTTAVLTDDDEETTLSSSVGEIGLNSFTDLTGVLRLLRRLFSSSWMMLNSLHRVSTVMVDELDKLKM